MGYLTYSLLFVVNASVVLLLAIYFQHVFEDKLSNLAENEDGRIVRIKCGVIRGTAEKSSYGNEGFVYKGVPYAKPPTGKRRWKPPLPMGIDNNGHCWNGTLDATKFGSSCPQIVPWLGMNNIFGTEDCLHLNVWRPKRKQQDLLPVVAYIHGGALLLGNNGSPGETPTIDFVSKLGVVAVSINYRLGALGFMALDVLTRNSESKSSGNYGFMDQKFALEWIRENIEAFGGDKNRVTLMGHSAGGTSCLAHLTSPQSEGLFHSAVLISSTPIINTSLEVASEANDIFLVNTDCAQKDDVKLLDCLYNLTAEEIISTTFPFYLASEYMHLPIKGHLKPSLAIVEPSFLPVSPMNTPDQTGDIPILFMNTAQETGIFDPSPYFLSEQPREALVEQVMSRLDTFSTDLTTTALHLYDELSGDIDNSYTYITMTSDVRCVCPTSLLARHFSRTKGRRIYRLITSQGPSEPIFYTGINCSYAFHGIDILAIFDFTLTGGGDSGQQKLYKPSTKDLTLRDMLHEELAHFIQHGKPRSQEWATFPGVTAVIVDSRLSIMHDEYHGKACRLWERSNLTEYGWSL